MNKHILVFDSGLGGTTIMNEISKLLPDSSFSYAMDNAAFPYGEKSNKYLLERAVRIFDALLPKANPDLVVIACNTASTLFLETLRERFQLPFVGVVPAIKPAANITENNTLGLLATRATIHRTYIENLHQQHASHCRMIRLDGQSLVSIAEKKMIHGEINENEIRDAAQEIAETDGFADLDTLILGCTHFPAIKIDLENLWPSINNWLDSGEAIARRVQHLLLAKTVSAGPRQNCFYSTAPVMHWQSLKPLLSEFNIHTHRDIAINQ